jgi:polypyrimidine tract-binding protein 2
MLLCLFFQNASAQAALQAASALSGQNETQGGPNTVLRVIIEHMVYPVTLEVLCQVSKQHAMHNSL